MKVKQLQFIQTSGINDKYKKYKTIYIAPIGGFTCSGGNAYYQVMFSNYDLYQKWYSNFFIGCVSEDVAGGMSDSLEEAQLKCQMDFERRIRANIDEEL